MHSLLEAYLDQVAAQLSALPVKRRNEELREMHQHLLNAVTVNRELGQSEEDAAANAVMQFGTPEDLGGNLVWAWRREGKLGRRDFWGAAISAPLLCWMSVLCLVHLLPASLMSSPSRSFAQPPFSGFLWMDWLFWLVPHFLLIGGLSGLLFPKRALAGATLGLTGYLAWFLANTIALGLRRPNAEYRDLAYFVMDILVIGIAAFAAKAGSRWRMTRSRRRRLARN